MKTFTLEQIKSWGPCYNPSKYLPEGKETWEGTALEVLRHPSIPDADKLWCVLREDCINTKTLRLFAVWCAEKALKLQATPDERSLKSCKVAKRFAKGLATASEAASAESAAWSAAWSAASEAESARSAAWSAARSAARSAASEAESAWSAASEAESARSAAWSAESSAWSAARKKQIRQLIKMLS
jgi:hypothetical protein